MCIIGIFLFNVRDVFFGDCEPVGEGVSELRFFFGSGYRIYFAEYDDTIIILQFV